MAQFGLIISRQNGPGATFALVVWRQSATTRQALHLVRDAAAVTRRELHLLRDAATTTTRQCLHLRYNGRELDETRQCLHLRRNTAPVARQCLRLWRNAAYAPRQGLHLLREPLPQPRQGLHLLREALPLARQCLHLGRDKYPLVRRCLHLVRGAEYAVAPTTRVTIAGTPVYPISIRVSEDADQAAITATLEFAEALPPGLGPPAPVVIEIFGIRYELAGESYSRSREFGSRSWTLTAASPAYRLQSRYAAALDDQAPSQRGLAAQRTGGVSGMASALARELAAPVPLDWQMVDWQVLPGRWSPSGSPLDALRDLVSAAGGILTSDRDGRLLALPWPPASPEDWASRVAAETDSLSAMISISDDADERELYNAVTVSDESTTGDLRIEEIPDTRIGGRAEVRVYQIPWQDDFDVRHCGASWVLLQDLGVEERTIEEEMLEIVDGQGRTQYPIYGIIKSRWNKVDLGAITPAEDGTVTTAVAAESLLYLSYTTRARRLLVDMNEENPEPIMLIAEDF